MNTHKKQPELVKTQLLTATAQLIIKHGLSSLTLDSVAKLAGISKGGLLHHFPSKQILLDSLFDFILQQFNTQLCAQIQADPNPQGRFTRAYILTTTNYSKTSNLHAITSLIMATDQQLAPIWKTWLQNHLQQAEPNESSILAQILRHAADGMWLDSITTSPSTQVIEKLIAMTYTI